MINQFRARLFIVSGVLIIFTGVVVYRLFTIQVVESKKYAERSRDQSQLRKITSAKRGAITDRFGRTLAVSVQSSISIDTDVLGVSGKNRSKSASVKRVYPLGDIAGPLLGYIGKDGSGLGGAELAFERYLRGEDGWVILQKDGKNVRYRKIGLPEKAPVNGCDVALTIDVNVQKIAQMVLRQAVEQLNAKNGLCIVMNPFDGSVLAMVNEPSFNPNMPSRYSIAERQNRCISLVYEPGSTFKLVTASAAMQENIKSENDLIFGDNGRFVVFDQTIRDHVPYGYLTFAKALTYSSNICFAKIANDIGNETFYRYVRDFGFGDQTTIDLPGEERGIVHPIKRWSGRTRVTMAMGQEISATLLQMMQPYAAVANGGVLVCPKIVEKVISAEGAVVDSGAYRPVRRVLSESVAARLRIMLRDVVKNGTGKRAAIGEIEVAGKTGTSQKPDSGGYSQTRSWSSFIGFVPVDKPVLLCGVLIDEPAGGEMGGEAAAPYFKKIITQVLSHPELEFAEKILNTGDTLPKATSESVVASAVRETGVKTDAAVVADTMVAPGTLPDCTGKNLRDAINCVNLSGFTPYVVGFGTVKRQSPAPGAKPSPAAACTLYCSVKEQS